LGGVGNILRNAKKATSTRFFLLRVAMAAAAAAALLPEWPGVALHTRPTTLFRHDTDDLSSPADVWSPGYPPPVWPPRWLKPALRANTMDSAAAAAREALPTSGVACTSETLPASERLLLTLDSVFFSGSTALQEAFMSSTKVATMCNGGSWQCEVSRDEDLCKNCRDANRTHESLPCVQCVAGGSKAVDAVTDFAANLELLAPFWLKQTGRSVLAVKWAPLRFGAVDSKGTQPASKLAPESLYRSDVASIDLEALETTGVPRDLASQGVTRVRWAVVIMYRPWCMWSMSRHATSDRGVNRSAWASTTLFELEDLAATHRELRRRNVPVLVMSYAQLLWRPWSVERRAAVFAPCVGALNLSFVPRLGIDVFEENELKVDGSIRSYGASVPPETFKLHPWQASDDDSPSVGGRSGGRCAAPAQELYAGLDDNEMIRAARVEEHLWRLSQLEPQQ